VIVPKCYKLLFTLSRALSRSLPCSLSPQTLGIQNPPSTLDPRPTGASLGWWIIYPACSIPGRLGFEPLVQGRAHPKVNKLGFGKSRVLGGLNWFPPVNHLLKDQSTRVYVGFDFCGLVLLEITISVFGAKNAVGSGDSGYKPGNSGFWTLRGKLRV